MAVVDVPGLSVYAQIMDYAHRVDILFATETHHGVLPPIEMQPTEQGNLIEPTLQLRMNMAQSLLDALIMAGMRPTTSPPTDQMIAALNKHIAFAEEMARRKR